MAEEEAEVSSEVKAIIRIKAAYSVGITTPVLQAEDCLGVETTIPRATMETRAVVCLEGTAQTQVSEEMEATTLVVCLEEAEELEATPEAAIKELWANSSRRLRTKQSTM